MTGPLRTVFMGTPPFAARILAALLDSPFAPVAAYSQPDRARGRGRKLTASAVKQMAEGAGVPVFTPKSLKPSEAQAALQQLEPDVLIVAAYGLILPQAVLDIPRIDCVNVHASLLPRWRGAAPIERAMMAGDAITGACIMSMEAGLDTGPVYREVEVPLSADARVADVEQHIIEAGSDALLEILAAFDAGPPFPEAVTQDEAGATYAHKLTETDRHWDWAGGASVLSARVRALAERMPVRASIGDRRFQLIHAVAESATSDRAPGEIVKVDKRGIRVQCATDQLRIESVQFEGKPRPIDAAAVLNGHGDLFQPGQAIVCR